MNSTADLYASLAARLKTGRRCVLLTRTRAEDNSGGLEKLLFDEEELLSQLSPDDTDRTLAREALAEGKLRFTEDGKGRLVMAEPYDAPARLLILGGGHIAKPLAEFAARCGFAVTVVDDRPDFANPRRFPGAKQVVCESFDRCFAQLQINRSTFAVVITRGHRHDALCLRQLLGLETAYTGMIGSKRRVRALMEQLAAEGFSPDALAAVQAPIGLDIGAVTPEEIAVSILSQLILYKRRLSGKRFAEPDKEVLAYLANHPGEPGALVTIIETKGSVPRETGAKMLVLPWGQNLGSIGGGCSESSVVRTAHRVLTDRRAVVETIDMTGDVAESEGMVCGGIMKVAIEPLL